MLCSGRFGLPSEADPKHESHDVVVRVMGH